MGRKVLRIGSIRATALATVLLGTTVFFARSAAADATACTQAHATGQREQKAGHLKAASEQFMACGSDDSCPEPVRNDCMSRYADVQKLIPSVIFSLTDASGKDVSQVQVYANDQLVASGLDGRAVALEPGKYVFRFVLPSGEEVSSEVVLREGEKNRVVNAALAGSDVAGGTTAPATPLGTTDSAPTASTGASLPVGFWVASGITVVALASFTTFAVIGRKKHESLADCSPDCSPSRQDDYDALKRNYLIADISLGAAAVSAGVATVLFLTSDRKERSNETALRSVPRVAVTPLGRGIGAGVVFQGAAF